MFILAVWMVGLFQRFKKRQMVLREKFQNMQLYLEKRYLALNDRLQITEEATRNLVMDPEKLGGTVGLTTNLPTTITS